jgi:hypothetical protein
MGRLFDNVLSFYLTVVGAALLVGGTAMLMVRLSLKASA